jgi:transposase
MEKKASVTGVVTRRKFDDAFKRSTVELLEKGRSIQDIAQSLSISESLLHKWKRRYGSAWDSVVCVSAENDELVALRVRVKELEMERDILKKALGIFSRET